MPFKNISSMNQKKSFIRDYLTGTFHFNSLCESYGISRTTGYALIKRYNENGFDGLATQSRRPLTSPDRTPEAIVLRIKFWRKRKDRNRWGAKKIQAKLLEEFGLDQTPSITTIHNVLCRQGLVIARKKRRLVVPLHPIFDPEENNEIWSIDHKGKFYLGNGKRCSPLTVCDSHSRHLFLAKGQYKETWRGVVKELKPIFQEWGQPQYLHSDNGSAFASIQSPCGYGSLSYWLLDHGIIPVFSDPGRPTQNGRHERMHRDLKAECCCPSSVDLRVQNRRMNEFVTEYNEVRPHEALMMKLPSEVHTRSVIEWVDKVRPPSYDASMTTRKVCATGALRWKSYEWVSISNALAGKLIGVKPLGNGVHEIYYRDKCLGYFQEGEQLQNNHFYTLISDRDLPQRYRDRKARKRK